MLIVPQVQFLLQTLAGFRCTADGQQLGDFRGDFRGDAVCWPKKGLYKLTAALSESGCGQSRLCTSNYHIQNTASRFFGISRKEYRLRKQRIAWNGCVGFAQFIKSQRRRELARIPYLKSIREEHDLHACVIRIIPVHDGIDDCYRNCKM